MPKLLIVKTSSLGDVIHNLPIISDIRSQHPDMEIDWLVEASFADIPKLHPAVNAVIPVAIRQWRKALFRSQTWQEISAFKHALSAKQYDFVLDSQGLLKSALLTTFAHRKPQGKTHGYDRHSIREPIASLFYQVKHAVSRQQHAVARNRALAAATFSYSIPIQLPDYGIRALETASIKIDMPYVIGLHGTSRDSKLWETASWITLGHVLEAQGLHLVLPWSNEAELKRANLIACKLTNATVLPKLTIGQLASVISDAKAAIGVDTGLSHLAAALNIPTVAIYTDTDPTLTGVCPGAYAQAINLGNIQQSPAVAEVSQALAQVMQL